MPISYSYEGPLAQPAYNQSVEAGYTQGVANARRFSAGLQQQYDQMAQARESQRMNIWAQNQAQQNAAYRQQQQNVWNQQQNAADLAQRQREAQQRQTDNLARMEQQHSYNMEMAGVRESGDMMSAAHKSRAALDMSMGAIDPSTLSGGVMGLDGGQGLYNGIQWELQDLDKSLANNSIKPQDYMHSLAELHGRMKRFQTPGMYRQPSDLQAMLAESQMVDPMTGEILVPNSETGRIDDKSHTGRYQHIGPSKIPVNTPHVDATGSVVEYDSSGKKSVYFDAPERRADIRKDIKDEMTSQESNQRRKDTTQTQEQKEAGEKVDEWKEDTPLWMRDQVTRYQADEEGNPIRNNTGDLQVETRAGKGVTLRDIEELERFNREFTREKRENYPGTWNNPYEQEQPPQPQPQPQAPQQVQPQRVPPESPAPQAPPPQVQPQRVQQPTAGQATAEDAARLAAAKTGEIRGQVDSIAQIAKPYGGAPIDQWPTINPESGAQDAARVVAIGNMLKSRAGINQQEKSPPQQPRGGPPPGDPSQGQWLNPIPQPTAESFVEPWGDPSPQPPAWSMPHTDQWKPPYAGLRESIEAQNKANAPASKQAIKTVNNISRRQVEMIKDGATDDVSLAYMEKALGIDPMDAAEGTRRSDHYDNTPSLSSLDEAPIRTHNFGDVAALRHDAAGYLSEFPQQLAGNIKNDMINRKRFQRIEMMRRGRSWDQILTEPMLKRIGLSMLPGEK